MSTPGTFDYQLSAAEEQRARKLHQESIVFDLLCQHAGGNIFDHFPKDIQNEFYDKVKSAGVGLEACIWAEYFPYEMSKQGSSDLLPQWLRESG